MDDHMLDKLKNNIELAIDDIARNKNYKTYNEIKLGDPKALKVIRSLITAHNNLVEWYYMPEYVKKYKINTISYINQYLKNEVWI